MTLHRRRFSENHRTTRVPGVHGRFRSVAPVTLLVTPGRIRRRGGCGLGGRIRFSEDHSAVAGRGGRTVGAAGAGRGRSGTIRSIDPGSCTVITDVVSIIVSGRVGGPAFRGFALIVRPGNRFTVLCRAGHHRVR